jgi:SHS2 domain-containing protein
MGYVFIDHTADVAADLSGPTLPELFRFAAQALTDTITDLSGVHPLVTQAVTLDAPTIEDLLVDWVNELIYRFEVHDLLVSDARVSIESTGERWVLGGTVAGEMLAPERHASRVLVKSATYHGLTVSEGASGWTARLVFDI